MNRTVSALGVALWIALLAPLVGAAEPKPAAPGTAARAPAKPQAVAGSIRGVDFQRGEEGEGNVLIDLSDPRIAVDVQRREGRIVLDFARTQLPEALRVRLDVKDFATPVQYITAVSYTHLTLPTTPYV